MPPAIIAAGIGAAATIGGAALSSKSSKKAANTAAAAQTANTTANNNLARELYGQNTANMQPFMQSGQRANRLLDGLLYGGPDSYNIGAEQGTPQAAPGGYAPSAELAGGAPGFYNQGFGSQQMEGGGLGDMDRISPLYGAPNGGVAYGSGMIPGGSQQPQASVAPATGQTPQNAWDTFRNSTNYQFRLGQGMDSLQQGYAGAGALQSGAAMKGITEYGQNFASNELNNYLGLLQGQQNLGANAAGNLAGVSNTYGNQVMQNNNNGADALSNAALLRGQANNQMYGGIASGLGNFASSFKWGR